MEPQLGAVLDVEYEKVWLLSHGLVFVSWFSMLFQSRVQVG